MTDQSDQTITVTVRNKPRVKADWVEPTKKWHHGWADVEGAVYMEMLPARRRRGCLLGEGRRQSTFSSTSDRMRRATPRAVLYRAPGRAGVGTRPGPCGDRPRR